MVPARECKVRVDDEDIKPIRAPRQKRSSAELFGIIFMAVVLGILTADGLRLLIVASLTKHVIQEFNQSLKSR